MSTSLNDYLKTTIGVGLAIPIQRVGSDFATAYGERLIGNNIMQILKTVPGELRWRPSFGCNVETYRHRNATVAMATMMVKDIQQAIMVHEPRVTGISVNTSIEDNVIKACVEWEVALSVAMNAPIIIGPVVSSATL